MYSLNPIFENRKKGVPFNQEQLNQIKWYLDHGFSIKEVQELTGISKNSLSRRIKENDWSAKKKRTTPLSQLELNEIHEKILQGISIEELSETYKISKENLADRIANNKWTKAKKKKRYTCNENYFDNIDNEHKAYWLGFLMADGYILSKRERAGRGEESQQLGLSLSIKDIEIFEKFKEDINSNHPVHIYKGSGFKENPSYGRILITSQHMVESLKKLGMVENKSLILKFPDISKELIPHFIRGYSDGDGSIVITKLKNGQIKYMWDISSTKEMCQSILNYFNKNNLKLYQRFPEREVNSWVLRIAGNKQVKKILDILYTDATIFLKRKYDKYTEM